MKSLNTLHLFLCSSLISKDIPSYYAEHFNRPSCWNVCVSGAALIKFGYRITGWSWRTHKFLHCYLFTCLIPSTFISSSSCNGLLLSTHLKMFIFARVRLYIKQFMLEVTYEYSPQHINDLLLKFAAQLRRNTSSIYGPQRTGLSVICML